MIDELTGKNALPGGQRAARHTVPCCTPRKSYRYDVLVLPIGREQLHAAAILAMQHTEGVASIAIKPLSSLAYAVVFFQVTYKSVLADR